MLLKRLALHFSAFSFSDYDFLITYTIKLTSDVIIELLYYRHSFQLMHTNFCRKGKSGEIATLVVYVYPRQRTSPQDDAWEAQADEFELRENSVCAQRPRAPLERDTRNRKRSRHSRGDTRVSHNRIPSRTELPRVDSRGIFMSSLARDSRII